MANAQDQDQDRCAERVLALAQEFTEAARKELKMGNFPALRQLSRQAAADLKAIREEFDHGLTAYQKGILDHCASILEKSIEALNRKIN